MQDKDKAIDALVGSIIADAEERIALADWLDAELQPIYARLQQRYGVDTGDIDPLTNVALEEATHTLSEVLCDWMHAAGGSIPAAA